MKTKEELNLLREEVENMNRKLSELNEEELMLVTGGSVTRDPRKEPGSGNNAKVIFTSMPPIVPNEHYVMCSGVSPEFDIKNGPGQYEIHVYTDETDNPRFEPQE